MQEKENNYTITYMEKDVYVCCNIWLIKDKKR